MSGSNASTRSSEGCSILITPTRLAKLSSAVVRFMTPGNTVPVPEWHEEVAQVGPNTLACMASSVGLNATLETLKNASKSPPATPSPDGNTPMFSPSSAFASRSMMIDAPSPSSRTR